MALQGRTYTLFSYIAANGAEAQGEIHPSRALSPNGALQVKWAGLADGTEGFKLELQGRMNSSHGWVVLKTVTEDDVDANGEILRGVRLLPHMRVEVTNVKGSPSDGEILATLVD